MSQPICLDYLKGLCNERRWKCKYLHPHMDASLVQGRSPAEEICKVWLLTGVCKFGDDCRHTHPPLGDSEGSSNHVSDVSDTDSGRRSSPEPVVEVDEETSMRTATSILSRLTADNFETLTQHLHELVVVGDVLLKTCIPLLFEKAIENPQNGKKIAKLCKRLCFGIRQGAQARAAACTQLWELVQELLARDEAVEEDWRSPLQFFANMYLQGLITESKVTTVMAMLVDKIAACDGDKGAFIHLSVKFLKTVGKDLDVRRPHSVDFYVKELQDLAFSHGDGQLTKDIGDLVELRTANWGKPDKEESDLFPIPSAYICSPKPVQKTVIKERNEDLKNRHPNAKLAGQISRQNSVRPQNVHPGGIPQSQPRFWDPRQQINEGFGFPPQMPQMFGQCLPFGFNLGFNPGFGNPLPPCTCPDSHPNQMPVAYAPMFYPVPGNWGEPAY